MRTVSCMFVAALGLAPSLPASAQIAATWPIAYRAPTQCPTEEGFLQRLRNRLGPSQWTLGSGRSLDVQIAAADGRYQGRLTLLEPGGRSTTKTLSDTDCEELVNALSLVATLALETDRVEPAGGHPTPTPPSSGAAAPPSAATTPPLASAPGSAPAPATARAPVPAPTPVPAPAPAPAPVERASAGAEAEGPSPVTAASRFGVSLGGFAATGPAPRPLFGAALTSSWTWSGRGPLRPTLELGAAASLSPDASEAQGSASFTWWTARAAVYLVQWPPGAGVALRAGFAGDFGVLVARGHDTVSPATSSRPWASVGAVLGLDVPLGSALVLRPTAMLEAPLRRDRYAFGSVDFFEVSFLVAAGGLAVVAYLP